MTLQLSRRSALAAAMLTFAGGAALAQTAGPDLQLPAPAERSGQTVSVNGADIFYSESGSGDPLVLLHGYPLSGALFERVRDTLDDNHRVITIDHRGYGNSTTPAPVESVVTYAEDALAVLSEIGVDKAVIGGMSMGGPIVFEMYRQKPEVFSGMILIDTIAAPAGPIEAGIWTGAEKALKDKGEVGAIIPFLMPNMLTGEARMQSPGLADYLETAMKQASLDGAIGGAKVLANRPDSTQTLADADVPVLVLVGRADTVYPFEVAQKMVETAKNGTLAIIDGGSHAVIFEQPEASAKAIEDWMAKLN